MSRPIQVMKFGGTSVGERGRIRSAATIAAEASKERAVVVVVSAMSGVTNTLIAAAGKAATGDEAAAEALTKALQDKHHEAIGELISDIEKRRELLAEIDALIERAANYCRGCALLGELSPRALDVIAGTGERLTARMTAAVLREMGLRGVAFDATDLIVTDEVHGGARPLSEPTRTKTQAALLPLLEADGIPVVTGYIAATAKGIPTTLGRGGSDYSATILGAALDAQRSDHLDRRERRADGGPAHGSRRGHARRSFLHRSGRTRILRRESAASDDAAPGDRKRHSRLDSQQLPAGAGRNENHAHRAARAARREGRHRNARRGHDCGRRTGNYRRAGHCRAHFRGDRVGAREYRDDFAIVLAGQHLLRRAGRRRGAHGKGAARRARTKTCTSTTSNTSR